MLTQDGKTMYLKLNGRFSATAQIWPEHKYMECEEPDNGVSRVGFVFDLKAGEVADVEVILSPDKKKSLKLSIPKLNLGRKNRTNK